MFDITIQMNAAAEYGIPHTVKHGFFESMKHAGSFVAKGCYCARVFFISCKILFILLAFLPDFAVVIAHFKVRAWLMYKGIEDVLVFD